MISSEFLSSCSEEEKSIIYFILYNSFVQINYEPSFSIVKFLKKNALLSLLEQAKNLVLPENISLLENLQKKIHEEI